MELTINGEFRLGRKIGSGSFGEVYSGTNMQTGEAVAIKMEAVAVRMDSGTAPGPAVRPQPSSTQLELEYKAYVEFQGGCKHPKTLLINYGVCMR